MIVEFTGCMGCGKSTLIAKVRERLRVHGVEVALTSQLVTERFGLTKVRNPTVRNVLLDAALLPRVLGSLRRYLRFYAFAMRILLRQPDSWLGAVNRLRSVARKIAVGELIAREDSVDRVVLVDEGTVHAAHNLFVYSRHPLVAQDIKTFCDLVPLPDIVVCVTAPQETVLDRIGTRKQLRLVFEPKARVREYVSRAMELFRGLAATKVIRARLLTIDTSNDVAHRMDDELDELIRGIVGANRRPRVAASNGELRRTPAADEPVTVR
jgi:thymidylate kinase